jgi:hypothetical protein
MTKTRQRKTSQKIRNGSCDTAAATHTQRRCGRPLRILAVEKNIQFVANREYITRWYLSHSHFVTRRSEIGNPSCDFSGLYFRCCGIFGVFSVVGKHLFSY